MATREQIQAANAAAVARNRAAGGSNWNQVQPPAQPAPTPAPMTAVTPPTVTPQRQAAVQRQLGQMTPEQRQQAVQQARINQASAATPSAPNADPRTATSGWHYDEGQAVSYNLDPNATVKTVNGRVDANGNPINPGNPVYNPNAAQFGGGYTGMGDQSGVLSQASNVQPSKPLIIPDGSNVQPSKPLIIPNAPGTGGSTPTPGTGSNTGAPPGTGGVLTQGGAVTAPKATHVNAALQPVVPGGDWTNTGRESVLADEQLDRIIADDSPLMQRARIAGMEYAAARGMQNSSMAAGAAQGAMIDRASPLAQANAQVMGNRALQADNLNFQSQDNNANRTMQARLANAEADNALQRMAVGYGYDLGKMDKQQQLDLARMDREQTFVMERAGFDRATQLQVQRAQGEINRSLQNDAARNNIGPNVMQAITAITLDPNLSPPQRTAAINQILDFTERYVVPLSNAQGDVDLSNIFQDAYVPPVTAAPNTVQGPAGGSGAGRGNAYERPAGDLINP